MRIQERILAWFDDEADPAHARYRSWEHCYSFFQRTQRAGVPIQRDYAALYLAFYLASWGMYRGSGFLLQHAYTIHLGVVDRLAEPRFSLLWEREFGSKDEDQSLVPIILEASEAITDAYEPFGRPTDILLSKIMLGIFGCLPACDEYFIRGFRHEKFSYSYLNTQFVNRVLHFCRVNFVDLRKVQATITDRRGIRYPLMKLVDMYFNQIGHEV